MISSDEAIRASTQWILGMSITWGEHSEDYAFRQSLQSHMDTVLEDGNSAGPEFYERFGGVYSEVGRWKAAEKLYVQARDAALGVHRAEHRYSVGHGEACDDVLESRTVKGGRELGLQVRDGCLKVLGAEHPDTLLAMGNFAGTYGCQGQWKETVSVTVVLSHSPCKRTYLKRCDCINKKAWILDGLAARIPCNHVQFPQALYE